MTTQERNIYGDVNSLSDLRGINRQIRQEIRRAHDRSKLTELKKRADYLCALTQAPSWQEKFGPKASRFLDVAKEEDERTTRVANEIARRRGFDTEYHAWGSD
ncbi:MAG TPA: hypothetical protein VFY10_11680 [Dehalococcoidia bacterium]|nr:hypothetical protein [Dehalococcoidia bacterium]